MSLLFTLAAFAVALGVLIVVHEFGHYLVARWCGVKVLRFSVGFGRPVVSKRIGPDQTEWAVGAFPLGGYVKMLDEREGEVAPEERHRAFNCQSVYRRMAIVAAGPMANFILAIALYWLLFFHGVPGVRPVLGPVPTQSAAAVAAFAEGDTIVRVGEQPVQTWQDVRWLLLRHAVDGKVVSIETRDGQGQITFHRLNLGGITAEDLDGHFLKKLGLTEFVPVLQARIGKILPNSPAERAGLETGDEILAINGQPVKDWNALVEWIRDHPDQGLAVNVRRGTQTLSLTLTPAPTKEGGQMVGKIGAGPWVNPEALQKLLTEVRYPPVEALGKAFYKTWDTSVFTLEMLGKMVIGQVSWKNISGPITIADLAGESAHLGMIPYFSFIALVSISLAVLNLLPIPLLDGGHLMYYIAEFVKGSPVSERTMEIGQRVGIALLMTLMVFAFYNDINRLITG